MERVKRMRVRREEVGAKPVRDATGGAVLYSRWPARSSSHFKVLSLTTVILASLVTSTGPARATFPTAAGTQVSSASEVWVTNQALDNVQIVTGGAVVDEVDLTGVGDGPHSVNFSSNGAYAFVASVVNGAVTSIRTSDRSVAGNLMIPGVSGTAPPLSHQAAPTPDGSSLLVAHIANKTLYEVSVAADGALTLGTRSLTFAKAPICTVFTSDGSKAYVSLATSGLVAIDMATFTQIGNEIATTGSVQCGMQPMADGSFLISANGGADATSGILYRLDPATSSLTQIAEIAGRDVHGLTASPDGKHAFATARGSETMSSIDVVSGEIDSSVSLDVTPGVADKPDQADYLDGSVYVTLREIGKLAVVTDSSIQTIDLGGTLVHGVSVLDRAAPTTRVTSPTAGQRINNRRFRSASGVAADDASFVELVQLALRKKTPEACKWWSARRQKLVSRSCARPLWFRAGGDLEWSYEFPTLPAGRYQLRSRGTDAVGNREEVSTFGANKVGFRLI